MSPRLLLLLLLLLVVALLPAPLVAAALVDTTSGPPVFDQTVELPGRLRPSSSSSSSSPVAALLTPPLSACALRSHPGVARFVREQAALYPALSVHHSAAVAAPTLQLFASARHRRDSIVDGAAESEEEIMERLSAQRQTERQQQSAASSPLSLTRCLLWLLSQAQLKVGQCSAPAG